MLQPIMFLNPAMPEQNFSQEFQVVQNVKYAIHPSRCTD